MLPQPLSPMKHLTSQEVRERIVTLQLIKTLITNLETLNTNNKMSPPEIDEAIVKLQEFKQQCLDSTDENDKKLRSYVEETDQMLKRRFVAGLKRHKKKLATEIIDFVNEVCAKEK